MEGTPSPSRAARWKGPTQTAAWLPHSRELQGTSIQQVRGHMGGRCHPISLDTIQRWQGLPPQSVWTCRPPTPPNPAACAFLKHWDRLLHLEESGSVSRRPEVWNMTGACSGPSLSDPLPGIEVQPGPCPMHMASSPVSCPPTCIRPARPGARVPGTVCGRAAAAGHRCRRQGVSLRTPVPAGNLLLPWRAPAPQPGGRVLAGPMLWEVAVCSGACRGKGLALCPVAHGWYETVWTSPTSQPALKLLASLSGR